MKDDAGNILELRCTYDPATKGGNSPDGRKVKATIHWVCAETAVDVEVRAYDRLFTVVDPSDVKAGGDYKDNLNAQSLTVIADAKAEPSLAQAGAGAVYQFERLGYFCVDPLSGTGRKVFNRTVTLRDELAKLEKRTGPAVRV